MVTNRTDITTRMLITFMAKTAMVAVMTDMVEVVTTEEAEAQEVNVANVVAPVTIVATSVMATTAVIVTDRTTIASPSPTTTDPWMVSMGTDSSVEEDHKANTNIDTTNKQSICIPTIACTMRKSLPSMR